MPPRRRRAPSPARSRTPTTTSRCRPAWRPAPSGWSSRESVPHCPATMPAQASKLPSMPIALRRASRPVPTSRSWRQAARPIPPVTPPAFNPAGERSLDVGVVTAINPQSPLVHLRGRRSAAPTPTRPIKPLSGTPPTIRRSSPRPSATRRRPHRVRPSTTPRANSSSMRRCATSRCSTTMATAARPTRPVTVSPTSAPAGPALTRSWSVAPRSAPLDRRRPTPRWAPSSTMPWAATWRRSGP